MGAFEEGTVVVVDSGQAGTVHHLGKDAWVLLTNGDMWYGNIGRMRLPQGPEDLAACPLEIDKFKGR